MGVGILRSQRIVLVVLVILAAAVLVYATEEFAGAEQLAATDKLAASAALGAGSALPGFLPLVFSPLPSFYPRYTLALPNRTAYK
jgi:hypothetical protein